MLENSNQARQPDAARSQETAKPDQATAVESELGLLAYIRSFGLEPGKLSVNQIYCLHAARSYEALIRKIQLPVATEVRPQNQKVRVEREVERMVEKTRHLDSERPVDIPSDSLSLSQLSAPEELRHLVAGQWLLEEIAPEQFDRMLISGELLKREWREMTQAPVQGFESVKLKELVEEDAPPTIQRPHAYVLLDVSSSMGEGIASNDTAAKGLALAFLRYAHEQRANMYARRFGSYVSELESGDSLADLTRVAGKIIWGDNCGGGTDIRAAIVTAVHDIRAQGSRTPADILLITDGYSKLGGNPLGNINLHTLRLDSGPAYGPEEQQALAKLEKWSKTFREIQYQGPSTRSNKLDASEFIENVNSLAGGYRQAKSVEEKPAIMKQIELLARYASGLGLADLAYDTLDLLNQMKRAIGSAAKAPTAPPDDFDYEKFIAEEQAERLNPKKPPTQARYLPPSPTSGGLLDQLDDGHISLWERVITRIRKWIKRE